MNRAEAQLNSLIHEASIDAQKKYKKTMVRHYQKIRAAVRPEGKGAKMKPYKGQLRDWRFIRVDGRAYGDSVFYIVAGRRDYHEPYHTSAIQKIVLQDEGITIETRNSFYRLVGRVCDPDLARGTMLHFIDATEFDNYSKVVEGELESMGIEIKRVQDDR